LCSIAEVLDWNGQWTRELVELMLPVAWEMENAQRRVTAEAVTAGIAAAFSKKGAASPLKVFQDATDAIRNLQRVARGGGLDFQAFRRQQAVEAFQKGFAAAGVKPTKGAM
jgi:sRNA-binding protein